MKLNLVTIILTMQLFSCQGVPSDVKQALEMSGENKEELKKVITHYQNPKDSLKLKAAYFLIGKVMPYEVFVDASKNSKLNSFFKRLKDSIHVFDEKSLEQRKECVKKICYQYKEENGEVRLSNGIIKNDLKTISATFLIENIEYAFKAWELPWSKKYNFDQFCEYILPYRSGRQVPNSWRKYFFEEFKQFRDTLANETDAVVVCKKLNRFLRQEKFTGSKTFYNAPEVLTGANMYKTKMFGNCVSISNLILESMRSIGIPVTEILMNKFGFNGKDHVANAVLKTDGNWLYFNGVSEDPGDLVFKEKLTKVYRKTIINEGDFTEKSIKPIGKLNLFGWKDITKEVMKTFTLRLPLLRTDIGKNEVAYLCIFDLKTPKTWVPIDWALMNKNKKEVVFKDVGGKEVVYIAMIEKEFEGLSPVSLPFILTKGGAINYLKEEGVTKVIVKRKHAPKPHLEKIAKALIGGVFEGANNAGFKNSKVLFTLGEVLDVSPMNIFVSAKAFRYYRFVYPEIKDGFYYDMAELAFGNKNIFDERKDKYLGSKGIDKKIIETLFDSDLLTYPRFYRKKGILRSYIPQTKELFLGLSDKVWVGVDFGTSKKISQIQYCPRTDKNGIYAGMEYELFYWENRWVSAGVKIAKSNKLTYDNVPKNTLFWLKNHTEGKEERIFTYENGRQIWW